MDTERFAVLPRRLVEPHQAAHEYRVAQRGARRQGDRPRASGLAERRSARAGSADLVLRGLLDIMMLYN